MYFMTKFCFKHISIMYDPSYGPRKMSIKPREVAVQSQAVFLCATPVL